jgi:hypothetical protein
VATKKISKSDWPGHREDVVEMLVDMFASDDGIVRGQMMGHPSWYVLVNGKKKLFTSAWEQGISLKLPEDLIDELYSEGRARPFEPMGPGKSMKGWVYIAREGIEELRAEEELIQICRDYVAGGQM